MNAFEGLGFCHVLEQACLRVHFIGNVYSQKHAVPEMMQKMNTRCSNFSPSHVCKCCQKKYPTTFHTHNPSKNPSIPTGHLQKRAILSPLNTIKPATKSNSLAEETDAVDFIRLERMEVFAGSVRTLLSDRSYNVKDIRTGGGTYRPHPDYMYGNFEGKNNIIIGSLRWEFRDSNPFG